MNKEASAVSSTAKAEPSTRPRSRSKKRKSKGDRPNLVRMGGSRALSKALDKALELEKTRGDLSSPTTTETSSTESSNNNNVKSATQTSLPGKEDHSESLTSVTTSSSSSESFGLVEDVWIPRPEVIREVESPATTMTRSRSQKRLNEGSERKKSSKGKSPKRRSKSPRNLKLGEEVKCIRKAFTPAAAVGKSKSQRQLTVEKEEEPRGRTEHSDGEQRKSKSPKRRSKSPNNIDLSKEAREVQSATKSPRRTRSVSYTNRDLEAEVRAMLGVKKPSLLEAPKSPKAGSKASQPKKKSSSQALIDLAQASSADTSERGKTPKRRKSKSNEDLEQEVKSILKSPKPSLKKSRSLKDVKLGDKSRSKPLRKSRSAKKLLSNASSSSGGEDSGEGTPRRSNRSLELEDEVKRMLNIAAPLTKVESQKKLAVGEEIKAKSSPIRKSRSYGDFNMVESVGSARDSLTKSWSLKGFNLDTEIDKLDDIKPRNSAASTVNNSKPQQQSYPVRRSQSMKHFTIMDEEACDFQVTFSGYKNDSTQEKIRRSLMRKEESVKSLGGGAMAGILDEIGGASGHSGKRSSSFGESSDTSCWGSAWCRLKAQTDEEKNKPLTVEEEKKEEARVVTPTTVPPSPSQSKSPRGRRSPKKTGRKYLKSNRDSSSKRTKRRGAGGGEGLSQSCHETGRQSPMRAMMHEPERYSIPGDWSSPRKAAVQDDLGVLKSEANKTTVRTKSGGLEYAIPDYEEIIRSCLPMPLNGIGCSRANDDDDEEEECSHEADKRFTHLGIKSMI